MAHLPSRPAGVKTAGNELVSNPTHSDSKPNRLSSQIEVKVGDPFDYPIEGDGKHWDTVLNPEMEQDKIQCAAWKEEIQNLLIFAGLFSSVLSSFVTQTYQSLQPDTNDQIIHLLGVLVNNTSPSSPASNTTLPVFSPTASSIRVNTLWTISLVFSLTTVLIGIVASQWLIEHQNYPSTLSTTEKFSLFHMRQQGLKKWRVPEVLSFVPLLLLLALMLFLVGFIDFIMAFQIRCISVLVIIAITLPLTFIVLTTTIPALQMHIANFSVPTSITDIPIQCPYRSTQARVFQRLSTLSKPTFLCYMLPTFALYSFICHTLHFVRSGTSDKSLYGARHFFSQTTHHENPFREGKYVYAFFNLLKFWTADSWISYDKRWIKLRTAKMRSLPFGNREIEEGGETLKEYIIHWIDMPCEGEIPFDCIHGITKSRDGIETNGPIYETQLRAMYHCVNDVAEQFEQVVTFQRYLQLLKTPGATPFPSLSETSFWNVSLRKEETTLLFLSSCAEHTSYFSDHTLELQQRLRNYSVALMAPGDHRFISLNTENDRIV